MEDSDPGEKVIYQLRDPLPVRAILLAAPVKRAAPEVDDPIAERRECPTIGRNCVVCEKAGKHLLQPFSLLGNWLMLPLSHLLFHFLELGPQAVRRRTSALDRFLSQPARQSFIGDPVSGIVTPGGL